MRTSHLKLAVLMSLTPLAAQEPSDPSGMVLDRDTGITLPKGFDAEIVYEVPESQGSWVALAFDPKGRLIVSDQDDKGLFRVTLGGNADGTPKVEPIEGFPQEVVNWGRRRVHGALGFLCAFDSVYASTMKGFYRMRDTDGDDRFDEFTLLKKLYPGWEHSAHSIIQTQDKQGLYLVSGNHSRVPEGMNSLQPPVWGLDSLLAPLHDPQGHARGVHAPGGWIARISPDGSEWTMVASGFRNSVDLAINRDGEMFTYDSDLEFDVGSPWYRPTRLLHVTSGGEFGWRAGSAKWPDYFCDGNGAVANIGPGSPTGLSFAYESSFPATYRERLFLCDWTFGTIYTADVEPSGSTYTATPRPFLSGAPLNISAMRFGPDGHMYFVVGGRNTDSKLYRVRYVGEQVAAARPVGSTENGLLRDMRHQLEAFHGSSEHGQKAIDLAWPALKSPDRRTRYAARVAIEWQDLTLWQDKVFAESDPRTVIEGVIALCHHGDKGLGPRVLDKLLALPIAKLSKSERLDLMRAYSLCFIRLDAPSQQHKDAVTAQLDPLYPAGDKQLDTELSRVLAWLDGPTVVQKTIALMKATKAEALDYDAEMLKRHEYGKAILETMANTPNSQNIHYAYTLRRVQNGWTLDDRKFYFTWLNEQLEKSGGKSFAGYIRAIREDAIQHLPEKEAASVSYLLGEVGTVDLASLPLPKGPPGGWTLTSAQRLFDGELSGRDYDNGKQMFAAGRCVACHRMAGEGGYTGPDLGSVGKRFSVNDILKSICDPNDTISEQYLACTVTLTGDDEVWGRVIYKNDAELAIATNPYDLSVLEKFPAKDVVKIENSPLSMMPPGTIAMMNADEVKDLIAYLVAGGDKKHRAFKK